MLKICSREVIAISRSQALCDHRAISNKSNFWFWMYSLHRIGLQISITAAWLHQIRNIRYSSSYTVLFVVLISHPYALIDSRMQHNSNFDTICAILTTYNQYKLITEISVKKCKYVASYVYVTAFVYVTEKSSHIPTSLKNMKEKHPVTCFVYIITA